MTTLQGLIAAQASKEVPVNSNFDTLSASGIFGKRHTATDGLTWGYYGGLYNGNTIANGTVTLTDAADNYVVVLRSSGVVSTSTSSTNSLDPLYAKLYKLTTAGGAVTVEVDQRWDVNGLLFNSGTGGTVTSVDASGGVETVAGTPITSTGTIRGATAVNAQTGTTYTYLTGDRGKLVTHTNAAAIAGTLPVAGGTFPANWYMWVQNRGAGTLTITPTTSTIDGAATLALTTGQGALIVSDGTNYFTMRGVGSAAGGSVATDAIWDAAGDLVQGTGANTAARLALGTAGQVLTVNGGATAAAWAAAAGGSGTKTYAVFTPMTSQPPAANFATLDTRNSIAVLDFDDTTEESIFWVGVMPEAASLGSGLIVNIFFAATTATTGDARFGAQFEKYGTDLDSDSFDTATEATVATSGTSGIETKLSITCTTIDSIAAGDRYRLRIYRDTSGADTITGDCEVAACEVRSAA